MSVPIEVLLSIIIVLFIRDIRKDLSKKPNNYEKGYRDAMKDVADKWNESINSKTKQIDHIKAIRDYLKKKLE